jgi:predicted outer membrane repeat protein
MEDTTIVGAGAAVTILDGAGIDRVIDAGQGGTPADVSVAISGLTITGGDTIDNQDSGGIWTTVGLMQLEDVWVVGNTAGSAGGIHNTGTDSRLEIDRGLILGNRATTSVSGGVETDQTNTTIITNSAVVGNIAEASGGGLYTDGILNLTNVTVSGNSTDEGGGGIHATGDSTPAISSSTITGNEADADSDGAGNGGGVFGGDTVTLRNTILAGNLDSTTGTGDADECFGTVVSSSHSILGHPGGCSYTTGPGDQVGTPASPLDPMLAPIADNGGPTQTHALLIGSPAVDAGNTGPPGSGGNTCPVSDQRGIPRGPCDTGAYELILCRAVPVNRVGTAGNDVLTGTGGADGFLAMGGNDRVTGLGGDDAACLAAGNDRASGGGGKDTLLGEAGKDKLNGGGGKDLLICGSGKKDKGTGGPGKDRAKKCERGMA